MVEPSTAEPTTSARRGSGDGEAGADGALGVELELGVTGAGKLHMVAPVALVRRGASAPDHRAMEN